MPYAITFLEAMWSLDTLYSWTRREMCNSCFCCKLYNILYIYAFVLLCLSLFVIHHTIAFCSWTPYHHLGVSIYRRNPKDIKPQVPPETQQMPALPSFAFPSREISHSPFLIANLDLGHQNPECHSISPQSQKNANNALKNTFGS